MAVTPLDVMNRVKTIKSATPATKAKPAAKTATAATVSVGGQRLAYTSVSATPSAYADKLQKSLRLLNPGQDDEKFDDLTTAERERLDREEEYGDDDDGVSYDFVIPLSDELGVAYDVDPDESEAEAVRSAYRNDWIRTGMVFDASAAERRLGHKAELRTVQQADFREDDFGDYDDGTHMACGYSKGRLTPDMGLRTSARGIAFDKSVRVSYRQPA